MNMVGKKCCECGASMKTGLGVHIYDRGGLHVTLVNVTIATCEGCDNEMVAIPSIEVLNKILTNSLIRQPGRLNGPEIRFLRKSLGWSSTDFAETFGVDASTISRWENSKAPIGPQADRLLRAVVAMESPIHDYAVHDLKMAASKSSRPSEPIRVRRQSHEWRVVELTA